MSVFLDIEPVPFRLLDDLMARMEANNDRLRARRGEKGSTDRPRARRPAHNAEESTYRRPEPAAHPRGGFPVAYGWWEVVPVDADENDNVIFSRDRAASSAFRTRQFNSVSEFNNTDGSYSETGSDFGFPPSAERSTVLLNGGTASWTKGATADSLAADLAAANGSYATELRQYNSQRYAQQMVDVALCLPVGPRHLVFVRYRHVIEVTSTLTRTRLYNRTEVANGEITQNDAAVINGITTVTITEDLADVVNTVNADSTETAFLVGTSTVREINFPTQLGDVLREMYPPPVIDTLGEYVPGVFNNQTSGTTSRATFVSLPRVFDGANAGVFRAGGYGIARASFPQWAPLPAEAVTATPGIFTALSAIRPGNEWDGVLSDQRVKELFDSVESLPSVPAFLAFCALDGTCGVSFYGMDSIKELPEEGPIEGFRKNRVSRLDFVPEPERPLFLLTAWDWSRAPYCRQQLLALGFSAEDLAP